MKIIATSDLHGFLPDIDPCDLLLIAGDICPVVNHKLWFQESWLDTNLRSWLKNVPAKHIVAVAGNHDIIFHEAPERVPKDLNWIYLQESNVEIDGLHIYGSPWQKWFYDWAFNAPHIDHHEEKFLEEVYSKIPDNTDIVLTHGPSYGLGQHEADYTRDHDHVGSKKLRDRMEQLNAQLLVTGHIHIGYGCYEIKRGDELKYMVANCSYLNESYKPSNDPMVFEYQDGKIRRS